MAQAIHPRIAAWQADQHELGMIQFLPSEAAAEYFPYYELPTDATFLGVMEADALCLTKDGSIVVYDHEVDRVLCRAASSQSVFVAALAELEKHFAKCVADEAYYNLTSAAVDVRVRCSEIAGGEEYGSFFSMMVGA